MVRSSQFKFRSLSAFAVCLLTAGSASAGLFCEWFIDPLRPYCSPEHESTWGVHTTSWRQFPMSYSQHGSYCPQCQAGGTINSGPMQTFSAEATAPSAIIIPQQQTSSAPMVFQRPNVSPEAVYNGNPAPLQFAPPVNCTECSTSGRSGSRTGARSAYAAGPNTDAESSATSTDESCCRSSQPTRDTGQPTSDAAG